jgi:hypothetical protein
MENFIVPLIFHNFSSYDGHFVVQGIERKSDVRCIPRSFEKFITMRIGRHLKIIDSLNFLNSSLANLVDDLKDEDGAANPTTFECTAKQFGADNLQLMAAKAPYPYSYFSGWDKFEETKLPPKEAYFNDLTNTEITDKEYARAKKIWRNLGLSNLGELHNAYLAADVALLADVVNNLRQVFVISTAIF